MGYSRLFLPIILLASSIVFAQTSEQFGLKSFCIETNELGKVKFYVTKHKIGTYKPLLLILEGSGHYPIYSILKKDGTKSEIIKNNPFNYRKLAKDYHVVLISKPGVPFIDSLHVNSRKTFNEKYKAPKAYLERLSLEWRVNSASIVIDKLSTELPIKEKEVIVIGYSEGGRTLPKLAATNKKITKVVSIVGGGLNQFYNFIINERLKAEKGVITSEKAQENIDNLYKTFKDIHQNPESTDKLWKGHTYKRWHSYTKDAPMDHLKKLDIPILLVAAGKDTNSSILGADYVKLDFLKAQKNNLTYKVYPNCNHFFYNKKSNENMLKTVIDSTLTWIKK